MLVNSPHLPNIDAIADTSRGKRSALADLRDAGRPRGASRAALRDAHVFLQGYRPGALAALGFGPTTLARLRPGHRLRLAVGLRPTRPLGRPARLRFAGADRDRLQRRRGPRRPARRRRRRMPMQILDMASGFLLAFGAAGRVAAPAQRGRQLARAGVAGAHRALAARARPRRGRLRAPPADFAGAWKRATSGFGRLVAPRHAAQFSGTPARYARPSMPPGTDPLLDDRGTAACRHAG